MTTTSEELPAYLTADDGMEHIARAQQMAHQSSISQRPLVELENAAKRVYQDGDVLNQLKWKLLSRAPLVTGGAATIAYGYSESGTPRLFAFGAIAAGTLIVRQISILTTRRSLYRKLRPTFSAFERLDKEFGIGRLEVYKSRLPQTPIFTYRGPVVLWYPPDGLSEPEIVRHLDRLAHSLTTVEGNVLTGSLRQPRRKKIVLQTKITLPKSLLDQLGIDDLQAVSEKHWLYTSHQVPIWFRKKSGDEQLVTLNKSQLMWCLDTWRQRQKRVNLTEHFVKLIEARDPRHPLVQAFHRMPEPDSQSREFTKVAQQVLERRLYQAGTRLVDGAEHLRDLRERISLNGELRFYGKEARVDWFTSEHKRIETTGLLANFNLSDSSLVDVLTKPGSVRSESVVVACEIALWLHGNKRLEFDLIEETQDNRFKRSQTDAQEIPLQERVAVKALGGRPAKNPKYGKDTLRIRSAVTTGALVIAVMVVPGRLLETASHHYKTRFESARLEILKELKRRGLDEDVAQALASHLAEKRIQHADPLTRASDLVHDMDRKLDGLGGPPIANFNPAKLFSGDKPKGDEPLPIDMGEGDPDAGQGGVGNVEPPPGGNHPDWFITSHGLDSSGYWPIRVYNRLALPPTKNSAMYWETDGNRPVEQANLPTRIRRDEKYLKVERVMTVDQLLADSTAGGNNGDVFFSVPVNYSDQISAAKLTTENGQVLELGGATLNDGTEALIVTPKALPTSGLIHVEYWLTSMRNERDLPHAVSAMRELPNSHAAKLDLERVRTLLDSAEQKYFSAHPIYEGAISNTVDRDQVYLRVSGSYKLAPIDVKHADVLSNPKSLTEYIIQNRYGNCNTTNTVLVSGNPALNLVGGYSNFSSSDGQRYLSSSESHAWATDRAGRIIDATPVFTSESKADSAFFAEHFKGMNPEFKIQKSSAHGDDKDLFLVMLGGAIALGGASFMTRRQRNIRKQARAFRKLDKSKPQKIQKAQQALDFAQFASPDSTFQLRPGISNPVTIPELYNSAKEIVVNGATDQVLTRLKEMARSKSSADTKAAATRAIKILTRTQTYLETTRALTGAAYADCAVPIFSEKIPSSKWKNKPVFLKLPVRELGFSPQQMRAAATVIQHLLYAPKDRELTLDPDASWVSAETELTNVVNTVYENRQHRQVVRALWKLARHSNDLNDPIAKRACLNALFVLDKKRILSWDPQESSLEVTSAKAPSLSR